MTLPYSTLRLILFFVLFPSGACLILMFLGKLTGFSMWSAVVWSFRDAADKSVKLLPLVGIIVYFCAYTMFFLYLQVPVQAYYVNMNNAGGLSGYMDNGLRSKLYDPVKNLYVEYPQLGPSLPASRFTDTFNVVVLYKAPTSEYYNDTAPMRLPVMLTEVIVGSITLFFLYMMLFSFAVEYKNSSNIPGELTHRLIASRFAEVAGISPLKALIIVLVVLLVIALSGIFSVSRITWKYRGIYSSYGESLRSSILKKVSPGETVRGTVVRRFQGQESDTTTDEGAGGRRTRQETRYYTVFHYTVEFRDIISVPVYLNFACPSGSEPADELNRLFDGKLDYIPKSFREFDFSVNSDYSISPKRTAMVGKEKM